MNTEELGEVTIFPSEIPRGLLWERAQSYGVGSQHMITKS
jgi:hypothetical protein